MKPFKALSIVIALVLVFAVFGPASAQLGTTDSSQIKIQNVSGGSVQVTVQFVSTTGTTYTPNPLSNSPAIANPFTLTNNQSILIDVSAVPSLPSGSYAVVISSTGKVVATASVFGQSSVQFSGAYPSFSGGANPVYLASAVYNWFGWYSMISVMNVGSSNTDVTVAIKCTNSPNVGLTGTLVKTGLAPNASFTWALKNTIPTGFTSGTVCQGGATISATGGQPIVAVNSNNIPASGKTNTFESQNQAYQTVYVPQMNAGYFGWNTALNIFKSVSGSTTATVVFGDGAPNKTCNLTDAAPACQLNMSTNHPLNTRFSATVTSSNGAIPLFVSMGTSNVDAKSGGYVGFGGGSPAVAVPLAPKASFGWNTAINCMNVSATPTTVNVAYEGYTPYNHPTTLNQGQSFQILTSGDSAIPSGFNGSVILTANAGGANIACMMGVTRSGTVPLPGDWTVQYNALPK